MSRYIYDYDAWTSRSGEGWINGTSEPAAPFNLDYHVDLGCGTIPKARIGIDRFEAPGVDIVADLDTEIGPIAKLVPTEPGGAPDGQPPMIVGGGFPLPIPAGPLGSSPPPAGLPFSTSSIKSIISHHALEHIRNLIPLMDEVYRVLEPGGIFFAITPLFPSTSAVEDPDHVRYFQAYETEDGNFHCSWDAFCGTPTEHSYESFSVPYTNARFTRTFIDFTPAVSIEDQWGARDHRELRVALQAVK